MKIVLNEEEAQDFIKSADAKIVLAARRVIKAMAKALVGGLVMVASWALLAARFPSLSMEQLRYLQTGVSCLTAVSSVYTASKIYQSGKQAKILQSLVEQKEKGLKNKGNEKDEKQCFKQTLAQAKKIVALRKASDRCLSEETKESSCVQIEVGTGEEHER